MALDANYKGQGPDALYTFLAQALTGGVLVPVSHQVHGPAGDLKLVTEDTPLPVVDAATPGAVQALQTAMVAVLGQILAKLITAPATAQAQADQLAALITLLGQTDGVETSLASILAKLSADPATATAQAAELVKLASLDAKLPALVSGLMPMRLGGTAVPLDLVADSAGTMFSPGSAAHAYTYDSSGLILTDTATLGGVVRVKTYTVSSGRISAETQWVVQ